MSTKFMDMMSMIYNDAPYGSASGRVEHFFHVIDVITQHYSVPQCFV